MEEYPPDLLMKPSKSPKFLCFLDCCKPKSYHTKDDLAPSCMDSRVVTSKEAPMEEPTTTTTTATTTTTSRTVVVPAKHTYSPRAFVEFLKLLLSFLLVESLGKGTKSKGDKVVVDEKQEDIPVL